jgi:succinyl-CoA synthetase beta subunit
MDLLEYQSKELFRQIGIPILPSQCIDHCRDLKTLKLSYPVVLKSQVYAGGRGKAGGVKFVENTIDAVAVAQAIFNLPIKGQYPEVLLAEAKYDSDQELYLAVALDDTACRPVLLGSQAGGSKIELTMQQLHQVVVEQEFSPFYARRLALKMGLQGKLIQPVSAIVEKMYHLFVQKDLDLVEINPLAVSSNNQLMALDGKVVVNDAALGRHPDLAVLQAQMPLRSRTIAPSNLNLVELDGNIGVLCNGTGLTMATLDLIHKTGGKPAGFVNLGQCFSSQASMPFQRRIEQGLELVTQARGVKVVLVNILSSFISGVQIAEAIASYLQRQPYSHRTPLLVVRVVGSQLEQARERLASLEVPVLDYLDGAIAQAVSLGKSKVA